MPPALLSLEGIQKRFGGVTALDGVDFDLRAGEVHALLGENGAGKSTLIKVLAGIHPPDAGRIRLDGREVRVSSPAEASALGIRVIHQELALAPNLSIAENIYLGREPARLGFVRRGRMFEEAEALVRSLGLPEIDEVRRPVRDLPVACRQLVEIARALSVRARVLVLDEPTSALSSAETEVLSTALERLRRAGVGLIYISHRLEEVLRLADRVTVLRDGRSQGTRRAAEVDRRELARWMVGREIAERFPRARRPPGRVVLEARALRTRAVRGVSFQLREGEVLGLAGLVGAGRTDLARVLFGIDRLESGELLLDGRPVRLRGPRDALRQGIVLVPEDRRTEGLVMLQSLAFNLALPWAHEWNPGFRRDHARRRRIVERAVEGFRIRAADPEAPVVSLSGGNQQKALVGRWMERRPRVLVLDEPTRGIDVGAREEMLRILGTLVEEGLAVLFISSDLAEVAGVSHRVALYRRGTILETLEAGQAGPEELLARLSEAP